VGRFIAGLARRGDTLFLEPAGYILILCRDQDVR
jgi:hypothetical protein